MGHLAIPARAGAHCPQLSPLPSKVQPARYALLFPHRPRGTETSTIAKAGEYLIKAHAGSLRASERLDLQSVFSAKSVRLLSANPPGLAAQRQPTAMQRMTRTFAFAGHAACGRQQGTEQDRLAHGTGTCSSPVIRDAAASTPSTDARLQQRHSPVPKAVIAYPPGVYGRIMANLDKEKQKLLARTRRIRGQVDAIERSLVNDENCAD